MRILPPCLANGISDNSSCLRQHRTIWQEHSAKDFASYESYKRAGILYVFPPFITARMGQKIGRRPQTQLCGDALGGMRLNQKLQKLRQEREKLQGKLQTIQGRRRQIDEEIVKLEDVEIVGIVRKLHLTPEALAQVLENLNGGNVHG